MSKPKTAIADTIMVQARIPRTLSNKFRSQLAAQGLTVQEVLREFITAYVKVKK